MHDDECRLFLNTDSEPFDPYVANLFTPEAFVEELSVV
jgi:hypothetical protein